MDLRPWVGCAESGTLRDTRKGVLGQNRLISGFRLEKGGYCFNWPKPRFTARERGFGPEELILVATGDPAVPLP